MISIPLGLITVSSAGTPVPITLTAAQLAQTSAGLVARVQIWPKKDNTGDVLVKQGTVVLARTSAIWPWETPDVCRNCVDPTVYSVDAATSADGAYVTLWVL